MGATSVDLSLDYVRYFCIGRKDDEMEIAKLQVSGTTCTVVHSKPIPQGITGATVSIQYTDPLWEGLTKTVVFQGAVIKDVIANTNKVMVPPETVSQPDCKLCLGVYGMDVEGNLVIPTLWVNLGTVQSAAMPSGDTTTEATPQVWEQILSVARRAEEMAEDVRNAAESGAFNGKDGPPGAPGKDGADAAVTSQNIAGALGYTPADDAQVTRMGENLQIVEGSTFQGPISPEIVRDLFRCAMSYINHVDDMEFTSSGSGTMLDEDFSLENPLFDCSSMVQAWIQGIPYEYSKHAGLTKNIQHYRYGITLPPNPYSTERPNRYYANELAHYLFEKGYTFVPNADYSDIAPGDLIFVSFPGRAGQAFHENAWRKIDHVLLVVGFKDRAHLTCLHTSTDDKISFYDVRLKSVSYDPVSVDNAYNDAVVLVGRIPYHPTNALPGEPVLEDTTMVTTTSTTNGAINTLTLATPLKKNMAYTAVVYLENAFDQSASAKTNYVGLRASFASGAGDKTIVSWQYNKYPEDHVYYLHFVTGDDPITKLKTYVLSCSVAGHKYKFLYLYEGFVTPAV